MCALGIVFFQSESIHSRYPRFYFFNHKKRQYLHKSKLYFLKDRVLNKKICRRQTLRSRQRMDNDFRGRRHELVGGSGGILPQEIFEI